MWQKQLFDAYEEIKDIIPYRPQLAMVLGSGLGNFADSLTIDKVIEYKQIKAMPHSTVEGHKGRFVFAKIGNVDCVIMQGRVHYYEGYTPQQVVMPVRLMGLMGAKSLIVTNAAGGITFPEIGSLMLITDHISLVPNPLIGENCDRLGTRFPDMSQPYDIKMREIAHNCAKELSIQLNEGVYMQFSGPSFETKADIKMAKIMGADAVGMSTAIEVIVARHMGMKVLGISCITNPACGISDATLSHVDVQYAADKNGDKLQKLLKNIVSKCGDKS